MVIDNFQIKVTFYFIPFLNLILLAPNRDLKGFANFLTVDNNC